MQSPKGRRFVRLNADRLGQPTLGRRLGQSIRELKAGSGSPHPLTATGLDRRSAMLARFLKHLQ